MTEEKTKAKVLDRWRCMRCGEEFEVERWEMPSLCPNPICNRKGPFRALTGPHSYFENKRFVAKRLAEEIMKKYPNLAKEENPGKIIAKEARIALGELAKPSYIRSVIRFIKNSEAFLETAVAPVVRREGEGEEKRIVQVSSLVTDEFIAQEAFDGIKPYFVRYFFNGGSFEKVTEIETGEVDEEGRPIVYVPVDNDHLRKGMVVLPREPKKATFTEVINNIFDFLTKDKRFDPCGREEEVKLLGLVAMGSWFLEKMRPKLKVKVAGIGLFAPIITIRGPSGSGKNRLANLLRFVSYCPYFDMSKTKIPSLFRPLDIWKGTLVLDEADFDKTGETSELIHFLNCRAQGTPIARQDPNNPKESHAFENFGLTIVTQRRPFDDNATEGRAIPFYSEKTDEKPSSVELDETVEKGMEIQDKLLYLRLKYWKDFEIDKAAWVEGIDDPRLNSSLLPVLAMAKFEPQVKEAIEKVARKIEERKIKMKANSQDGIIVNFLWERIQEGLFDKWLNYYYVAFEIVGEGEGKVRTRVPLSAKDAAELLGWLPKSVRKVVDSLNLAPEEAPNVIRVGDRAYRPIFFDPKRLEKLLREFVVGYEKGHLFKILGIPRQAQLDTFATDKSEELPARTHTAGERGTKENVTDVTDVTGVQGVLDTEFDRSAQRSSETPPFDERSRTVGDHEKFSCRMSQSAEKCVDRPQTDEKHVKLSTPDFVTDVTDPTLGERKNFEFMKNAKLTPDSQHTVRTVTSVTSVTKPEPPALAQTDLMRIIAELYRTHNAENLSKLEFFRLLQDRLSSEPVNRLLEAIAHLPKGYVFRPDPEHDRIFDSFLDAGTYLG